MRREGIPAARRDGVWSGETALVGEDGREIPVSQVIIAHTDQAGGPAYLSTIMRDMTERLRIENALRDREANLRLIFDVAPIGIVLIGPDGRFLRANAAFERIVDYYVAELRSMTIYDITPPEDVPLSRESLAALENGRTRACPDREALHSARQHPRLGAHLRLGGARRSGALPPHRLARRRHHRSAPPRGGAAPGAEDGEHRTPRRRRGARLQQPAHRDSRLRRSRRHGGLRRSAGARVPRPDPLVGRTRGPAHAAAARLRAQADDRAASDRVCPRWSATCSSFCAGCSARTSSWSRAATMASGRCVSTPASSSRCC